MYLQCTYDVVDTLQEDTVCSKTLCRQFLDLCVHRTRVSFLTSWTTKKEQKSNVSFVTIQNNFGWSPSSFSSLSSLYYLQKRYKTWKKIQNAKDLETKSSTTYI